MILRLAALVVFLAATPTFVAAQSAQDYAQLRLYVQQLEEQVRMLTGQVEQLQYELQQARQTGGAPVTQGPAIPEAPGQGSASLGAPPSDLGTVGIAQNDPLIAPDGATEEPGPVAPGAGGPIDLSTLAGGGVPGGDFGAPAQPGSLGEWQVGPGAAQGIEPGQPAGDRTAMIGSPPPTVALSGSARDEYDLAYGYVLTGDYDLAEQSFRNWLASFPQDEQATDARFWLGESIYQQGDYRAAANTFLEVYKGAPQSAKAPDALIKLGMSLLQLGERDAACGTLKEFGKRFPEASANQKARVNEEIQRAGCG